MSIISTMKQIFFTVAKDYREEAEHSTGYLGSFEWGVILTATVGLTVMNFAGSPSVFLYLAQVTNWFPSAYWELGHLVLWVCACILGYVVLPIIFLKINHRSLSDYYLSPKGLSTHLTPYVLLGVPASLLVFWVSYWPDFQAIYPFYSLAGRSWFDLILWELSYGVQFLALEFFFRAFLLESLRKALGMGAIAVMLVPYCMIHFPKTAAESLGSIIAGIVLGYLSMKSRSIWGGVLLHWFIAVEMDVLSLIQRSQLPSW